MHLGRSMARLFVHVYYFLRFFKVLSTRTRVVGGATSVAVSPCAFRSSGSAPSSSNVSTAVARLNRHARCNKVIPDESFPLTSTRPDRRMASSAAASFALTASLAPAFVFSYVVVVDAPREDIAMDGIDDEGAGTAVAVAVAVVVVISVSSKTSSSFAPSSSRRASADGTTVVFEP